MNKHINLILDTELTEVALSDLLYEIKRRIEDPSDLSNVETDDLIHALEFRGKHDVYPIDFDPIEECGDFELMEELESRGYHINSRDEDDGLTLLPLLYELKSTNDPRFDLVFADLIYKSTGRIL